MSVATLPTRPRGGQFTAKYVTKTCATCEEPFELREKMAHRVSNCDGCRVYRLPSAGGWCVATRELGPIVDEIIERRDRTIRKTEVISEGEGTGALERFCEDVARTLGMQTTAVVRRVYALRRYETRAVNSAFADACFLADGRFIEQEDIRVFPSTLWAAKETEQIEAEDRGETLGKDDLELRARARLDWATKEVLALDDAHAA